MKLSRRDVSACKRIAEEEGLESSEVRKAVLSFFDSIISDTRKLPFDNPQRIYSKDAFLQKSFVVNIPYIGRIGPVYSRYIKWRSEEAEELENVSRKDVRRIYSEPLIEAEAKKALSGQKVNVKLLKERIPRGKYNKVWMICGDGKRKAARQVIVNKKNNK